MTLAEKIKLLFSKIWLFLGPFVKLFLSEAGQVLAVVALRAVKDVAATMGQADGDAKRKAAFNSIVEQLKVAGVELAASSINAAIEAAVLNLKAAKN